MKLCIHFQKNTVSLWVNRFEREGTLEPRPKSGRPRITTPEVDRAIFEFVDNEPFTASTDVARSFDLSATTVRRRLHEFGLFHFIPAVQTKLTDEHRHKRIEFCEQNMDLDWENVIFSDEKTFKTSVDTKQILWRPKNARFNPKYVQSIQTSGRVSCGVWGFITAGGVGQLCRISPGFKSREYISVLDEQLLPALNAMFPGYVSEMKFMQDNARMHTSRETQAWLRTHPEITLLEWPARSPDLNPIENVWARMVYKWQLEGPNTKENILQEVERRWEEMIGDTNYIDALYRSMPNRLQEVLDNHGNWCSY